MSRLYTIGHSNRTIQEFLSLLNKYKINYVLDVRSIPKSRHFPWFNQSQLKNYLKKEKIKYSHIPELGGLRRSHKDSINQGWHNLSFRGFADYMQTPEFFDGLKELNQISKSEKKSVIMCAEAVPWRCHRSLIADAELVRGKTVLHIMSLSAVHKHELTPFAVVDRTKRPIKIYYP